MVEAARKQAPEEVTKRSNSAVSMTVPVYTGVVTLLELSINGRSTAEQNVFIMRSARTRQYCGSPRWEIASG